MDTVNCTLHKRHAPHDFDNSSTPNNPLRAHCPGLTAAQAREIREDYYGNLCGCGDQDCPCDGNKIPMGVGKAPSHSMPSTRSAHDAYTDDPWES